MRWPWSRPKRDPEMATAVAALGVRVSHHYPVGRRLFGGWRRYVVHVHVDSLSGLDRLTAFSGLYNTTLQIYGDSGSGYCCSVGIDHRYRDIVRLGPPDRIKP